MKCAAKIFAEKSFEGARISDIGKMAMVPNSLIYYHFKSKDEILVVLIEEFISRYKQLIASANQKENVNLRLSDKMDHYYLHFVEENLDVLRILLSESLKINQKPYLFFLVEELVKFDELNSETLQERLVAEMFTNIIPIISFKCFEKKWCEYFSIEKEKLSEIFNKLISETHGSYHQHRENSIQ